MPRRVSPDLSQKGATFESLVAQGLDPRKAWREAGFETRAEADRALGHGALRRAEYAYDRHRGGKMMHALLPGEGWVPARVYDKSDRITLARYANAVRRYADGDRRALDQFKGKVIYTSQGRVELLTDRRSIAALDRADLLRGTIDRLYAR